MVAEVAPTNATDKKVAYTIAPITSGLAINQIGKVTWEATVSAGEYTITVKTVDGDFTATTKLTLTEPEAGE
ncbi:hypothetical protein [Enterococcus sp. S86.2]|uniref:hypothetical protein n=1 Tax=Enterococcus sp. S86.2 TaxID=3031299 RepID=UPI0026EC684E|nr:hypothetical protein [Enterococcus sp. S86.2]